MRVYQLARIRGERSAEVIATLRADGEWIASHLSVVPSPVLRRYLPATHASAPETSKVPVSHRHPPFPQPAHPPRSLPRLRRRPGPRPISLRRLRDDDYDDRLSDLRYESQLTTRDVADVCNVTQGTVRQWVARGYLIPIGREAASNVFSSTAVLAAFELIQSRRRATGMKRPGRGLFVERNAADRVHPKYYDVIITIAEAARLVDVSTPTIRSWILRGHLTPTEGSEPRAVRLRVEDVVRAAQARAVPARIPARRRIRAR